LALLLTKLHKLPKTVETLNVVVDTDLTFAIKRINWVADDFRKRGVKLKRWQLIELACIYRFKDIPIINETIAQILFFQNKDLDKRLLA
jgi:hypothetical protein